MFSLSAVQMLPGHVNVQSHSNANVTRQYTHTQKISQQLRAEDRGEGPSCWAVNNESLCIQAATSLPHTNLPLNRVNTQAPTIHTTHAAACVYRQNKSHRHTHTHTCAHTHTCMHVHTCTYTHTLTCMHACTHAHAH